MVIRTRCNTYRGGDGDSTTPILRGLLGLARILARAGGDLSHLARAGGGLLLVVLPVVGGDLPPPFVRPSVV
jgi:hypothetical protein